MDDLARVRDEGDLSIRADHIGDARRRTLLLLAALDEADPTFCAEVQARLKAGLSEERGVLIALAGD